MHLEWMDYRREDGKVVDSWLDGEAVAMTGLDQGWDDYWQAVRSDGKHYPGCRDVCKIIREQGQPIAAVCFGWYGGVTTVSEILVAPQRRGQGVGVTFSRTSLRSATLW